MGQPPVLGFQSLRSSQGLPQRVVTGLRPRPSEVTARKPTFHVFSCFWGGGGHRDLWPLVKYNVLVQVKEQVTLSSGLNQNPNKSSLVLSRDYLKGIINFNWVSQLSGYTWQCVSIWKWKDSLPYGVPRIHSQHLCTIQLMISPGRHSGKTRRQPSLVQLTNSLVYTPILSSDTVPTLPVKSEALWRHRLPAPLGHLVSFTNSPEPWPIIRPQSISNFLL